MSDKKNSDSDLSKLDLGLFFQKKITTQTPSQQQHADSEKTEIAKIPPAVEKTEIKEIFPLKKEENTSSENDELEKDSTLAGVPSSSDEDISQTLSSSTPSTKEIISLNSEKLMTQTCHICKEVTTEAWCHSCGTAIPRMRKASAKQKTLPPELMAVCQNCGLKTSQHKICPNCGNRISLPFIPLVRARKKG